MTNPIYRDGITAVQDPLPEIEVQQFQASRGLVALSDTIDRRNAQTGLIQCLSNFLGKIYSGLISIINALKTFFCKCSLRTRPNLRNDQDEIANVLASFNNLRINGQIGVLPRFNDRKRVNMSKMGPFTIVESRGE